MKKILFASTALIASAGVAAADVSVSGDGRMGVTYNSSASEKFAFNSRLRITFRASGETDSGLQFGGQIRSDQANTDGTAGHVFISGAFGRISMGDVDGAAEFVVGDLHQTSLTGLGFFNENLYLSNDGSDNRPAMRYDYTMDAFTFAISADNPSMVALVPGELEDVYGIGVSYDAGMFGVALGHERGKDFNGDSVNHTIAALTASVDGVGDFKAVYGRATGGAKQYGISGRFAIDATTVSAFARREDDGTDHINYVGIGAAYDLGGGASLTGGIVNINPSNASSTNRADFGVSMRF